MSVYLLEYAQVVLVMESFNSFIMIFFKIIQESFHYNLEATKGGANSLAIRDGDLIAFGRETICRIHLHSSWDALEERRIATQNGKEGDIV